MRLIILFCISIFLSSVSSTAQSKDSIPLLVSLKVVSIDTAKSNTDPYFILRITNFNDTEIQIPKFNIVSHFNQSVSNMKVEIVYMGDQKDSLIVLEGNIDPDFRQLRKTITLIPGESHLTEIAVANYWWNKKGPYKIRFTYRETFYSKVNGQSQWFYFTLK